MLKVAPVRFRTWNFLPIPCSVALVTRPGVGRSLSKVACVLAAVGLVLFCASAARLTLPGLREDTRAAANKLARETSTLPVRHKAVATAGQGGDVKAAVSVMRPVRPELPRPAYRLLAPPARAPGSDALGTGSLPRSARWLVLGGHGRHGAG